MVQDVVDVVESYSEQGRFPQPFSSQINQRNLGFADARRLVHENIVQNRILVPERVDLVRNMVRGYRVKSTPNLHISEVVVPQQVIVPQVVPQVVPQMKRVSGYRFNYLPVVEPFKPNIFASRVGESLSYGGRVY